jgi:hypothetical protein
MLLLPTLTEIILLIVIALLWDFFLFFVLYFIIILSWILAPFVVQNITQIGVLLFTLLLWGIYLGLPLFAVYGTVWFIWTCFTTSYFIRIIIAFSFIYFNYNGLPLAYIYILFWTTYFLLVNLF